MTSPIQLDLVYIASHLKVLSALLESLAGKLDDEPKHLVKQFAEVRQAILDNVKSISECGVAEVMRRAERERDEKPISACDVAEAMGRAERERKPYDNRMGWMKPGGRPDNSIPPKED